MKQDKHHRARRRLVEAEGYLELGMPEQALDVLASASWHAELEFFAKFFEGLALRDLKRYAEAVPALEAAHRARPEDIDVLLALGWCLKRTDRLRLAIESLERAREAEPENALVHYNLACYHALAGEGEDALEELQRALELDSQLRRLILGETDFDPVRDDPRFRRLAEEDSA